VYEAVGGLDTQFSFAFDYDLFVRLRQVGTIRAVSEYLAAFRLHPRQKTATCPQVGLSDDRRICRKHGFGSLAGLAALARRARPVERITEKLVWRKDRQALQTLCQTWPAGSPCHVQGAAPGLQPTEMGLAQKQEGQ
jgi:hypothetical protein